MTSPASEFEALAAAATQGEWRQYRPPVETLASPRIETPGDDGCCDALYEEVHATESDTEFVLFCANNRAILLAALRLAEIVDAAEVRRRAATHVANHGLDADEADALSAFRAVAGKKSSGGAG